MSRTGRRLQAAAQGARTSISLVLSPASRSYSNGATVTVTILVKTGSTEVNTVQANLTYPTNRLSFQSISTSGSPFTTVIESSGGSGSVRLGSGILGGSTSGTKTVAIVTFTASGVGSVAITFAAGSGVADANTSSDVLQSTTGATYTIT
ncbi:MAG: hypothetical protein JWO54_284 [Candidatus Saccharibacteria bacterium]|nr:hypothetical protein [Candidatus Saccharibacteria bacterium]MDB5180526.1 hypothetical protein [Candidatus Saccharibacteria bacterium]